MLPLLPCLCHAFDCHRHHNPVDSRWGFHDRLLTLRSALANFLKHGNAVQAIYRRWRWQVLVIIFVIIFVIVIIVIVVVIIILRQLLRTGSQGWV